MLAELESLAEAVRKGNIRALARAISLVEEGREEALHLSARLYPYSGGAMHVGFVGPVGTGKSTLIDRLISEFRKRGFRVGVLSVDPSSHLTGGSILGDRIRMTKHTLDEGVYIRSLAARGKLGGLARRIGLMIRLLEAAGFEVVLMESIGAGQADVQISRLADITVVVLMPALGDELQALKAGLMESGNIYVLNKADLQYSELALAYLRQALLDRKDAKVLRTIATKGEGVEELCKELLSTLEDMKASGRLAQRRREMVKDEVMDYLFDYVKEEVERLAGRREFLELLERVYRGELDPLTAALSLRQEFLPKGVSGG
ncbi:MAG: methylmalonyl Co-A mutase-associated GTPase MeaB [Nitrososphaerota archaeon]